MEKQDTKYVDLETTLKAVGKEVFVNFYYDFKYKELGFSQLAEKIYKENPKSRTAGQSRRIYRAYHIFENNRQVEALRIIINSSKVTDKTIQRAKELLLEESAGENNEKTLEDVNKILKTIGKAAFVNFYYDFKLRKLNRAQLSAKLHKENPKSTSIRQDRRIDCAREIFGSNSEKKALNIIINSTSKVSDEIKLKAKEILEKEMLFVEADKDIEDGTIVKPAKERIAGIKRTEFSYVRKHASAKSKDSTTGRVRDFVKEQKIRSEIGKTGEEIVLEYEIARLKSTGLHEYSTQVKSMANDISKGYDILSYDMVGDSVVEIFIEVKTSESNSGRLRFFISSNELEKFRSCDRHRIYYLYKKGDEYNLHVVDKTKITDEVLAPMIYLVDIDGEFDS